MLRLTDSWQQIILQKRGLCVPRDINSTVDLKKLHGRFRGVCATFQTMMGRNMCWSVYLLAIQNLRWLIRMRMNMVTHHWWVGVCEKDDEDDDDVFTRSTAACLELITRPLWTSTSPFAFTFPDLSSPSYFWQADKVTSSSQSCKNVPTVPTSWCYFFWAVLIFRKSTRKTGENRRKQAKTGEKQAFFWC